VHQERNGSNPMQIHPSIHLLMSGELKREGEKTQVKKEEKGVAIKQSM